jgi:predicted SnoaL-like aldol condensation-catalyzing enzyme
MGDDDLVLVVSEGKLAGKSTSFYDIFRVKEGKIVEHWDNIEKIPEKSEWKNDNGKFNF